MPLEATAEEWQAEALEAIERLALSRETFTCEDLRREIPAPHHHNSWGAPFRTAAKRGLIVQWDYRPSSTRSRRGGSLRVWTAAPSLRSQS